jgi:hypothetical protein
LRCIAVAQASRGKVCAAASLAAVRGATPVIY